MKTKTLKKNKVNVVTLGCSKNLFDSEVMDKIFTVVLNKGDITTIVRELENYEVSQVCDEMTIFLKHKMLAKDTRFDLLLFDRFFRILSDTKQLLAMNSDGGFVLILTLMKMVEAVDIKTIDDIINQIQKIEPSQDVAPMVVQAPVAPVSPIVEPRPVIQEPTPVKETEAVVSAPIVEEVKQEIVAPVVEEKIVEEIKNETPIEERSTVEEELKNIVVEGVVNSNPFDDMPSSAPAVTPTPEPIMMPDDLPETKIEELTPADEVLVESTSFVDLGLVDAIETVSYPNPFDEGMSAPIENQPVPEQTQAMQTPTPVVEQKQEELITPPAPNESLETVVDEAVKEIVSQEVEVQAVEQQVPFNPSAEVEVVPVEEPVPSKKTEVVENVLYIKLTEKVYDRDYSLGECFEKNFIFRGFSDNKLSIASYAQGDDRKFLYKHFALIRTFAQDIFGNEVELDFKKEEPRQA